MQVRITWFVLLAMMCGMMTGCVHPDTAVDDAVLDEATAARVDADTVITLRSLMDEDGLVTYVYACTVGEDPELVTEGVAISFVTVCDGVAYWRETREDGLSRVVGWSLVAAEPKSQTSWAANVRDCAVSNGDVYAVVGDTPIDGSTVSLCAFTSDGLQEIDRFEAGGISIQLDGWGSHVAVRIRSVTDPENVAVIRVYDTKSACLADSYEVGSGSQPIVVDGGVVWLDFVGDLVDMCFAPAGSGPTLVAQDVIMRGGATTDDGVFFWLDPRDQEVGWAVLRCFSPSTQDVSTVRLSIPDRMTAVELEDLGSNWAVVEVVDADMTDAEQTPEFCLAPVSEVD